MKKFIAVLSLAGIFVAGSAVAAGNGPSLNIDGKSFDGLQDVGFGTHKEAQKFALAKKVDSSKIGHSPSGLTDVNLKGTDVKLTVKDLALYNVADLGMESSAKAAAILKALGYGDNCGLVKRGIDGKFDVTLILYGNLAGK